jgi:protein gp37
MSENSAISWTDHTFNPWVGCTKVSPACNHCYAERWAKRAGKAAGVVWGGERRRTAPSNWAKPLKWNAQAAREGRRMRVFCASLADVFDNQVAPAWRAELFALIAGTPNLDWLLLTKRIGNAHEMIGKALIQSSVNQGKGPTETMARWPWPNVWLGATICNQAEANRDIPKLLAVPARVRFLSIEPMLGALDLTRVQWPGKHKVDVLRGGAWDVPGWHQGFTNHSDMGRVHWVIVGGESGPNARPMHPDWARSLRDQCAAAGVPFHFKQWGEWAPDFEGAETCSNCGHTKFDAADVHGECGRCGCEHWEPAEKPLDQMRRVGTKAAGRLLDGALHDAFPEVA